jgi:ferrous iron transport protein B
MDRILRPFGLNGKSIVPLVSGTACAIPAVISTRNIENVKERLLTILVTPFMTCSARLPVYSIIIGLIISDGTFLGIKYKALVLMGMYLLGFLVALFSAFILKRFIKNKGKLSCNGFTDLQKTTFWI